MKIKKLVVLCAAALFALGLVGCGAPAASGGESSTESGEASQQMSGAYTEQREVTAEEKTMFETVMKDYAKDKTYEPVSVATQVVAGKNYKFLANVTEGETTSQIYVVIFEPLPNSDKEISVTKELPVE